MTTQRNFLERLLNFRLSGRIDQQWIKLCDRRKISINRLLNRYFSQFSGLLTGQSLFVIGLAIVLWACQGAVPPGLSPMAALDKFDPVDANIYKLRTGDLIIKVVDRQQRSLPNATVQIEQISHDFLFGTALRTELFSETANSIEQSQYLNLVKRLFNAGVHENALKWYSTEPVRGQVSYADADRILEWSEYNHLKMRGHTLFWAVEKWNQPWVRKLTAQELREAVQQRTLEICRRYRGRFIEYDVVNELLHGDFYQARLGAGIVGDIFRWCHTADPTAGLYVNDYDILNGKSLNLYIDQIRSLLQQGVPVSGIGIQGHIRETITGDRVKASLDALAQFGLPIKITEFDAVAKTEQEQARILKEVYRTAFAHPAVTGIFMWGFWEGGHWEPKAAIFKQNFEPKLAATQYEQLIYRDWWTQATGKTNQIGEIANRAFFGNYRITITTKNRTFKQTVNFSSQEKQPKTIIITAM